MRKKLIWTVWLFRFVLSLGVFANSKNVFAGSDGGRLELTLDKAAYLLGEPFIVRVKLVKQSSAPLAIDDSFRFGENIVLLYQKEGDDHFKVRSTGGLINETSDYPKIQIGKQGIETMHLFSGGPVSVAGRVDVWVRFIVNHQGDYWESNIVSVLVSEPLAAEKEAADLWLDADIIDAFDNPETTRAGLNPRGEAKIEDLIKRFGNTRYGDFARSAQKRFAKPPVPETRVTR